MRPKLLRMVEADAGYCREFFFFKLLSLTGEGKKKKGLTAGQTLVIT